MTFKSGPASDEGQLRAMYVQCIRWLQLSKMLLKGRKFFHVRYGIKLVNAFNEKQDFLIVCLTIIQSQNFWELLKIEYNDSVRSLGIPQFRSVIDTIAVIVCIFVLSLQYAFA